MRAGQANPKIREMYAGLTDDDGCFNGAVRVAPAGVLALPLRTKKPTVWAVWNDLFHPAVPSPFIRSAWLSMRESPRHCFVILTKRVVKMYEEARFMAREFGVLPNVVLGVTVENGEYENRLDVLVKTPAAARMVSVEPILGPVDLRPWLEDAFTCPVHGRVPRSEWTSQKSCGRCMEENGSSAADAPLLARDWLPRLGWVVAGGESGPGARPTNPRWALDLRDQCAAAGVPFLWKGWGEYVPADAFGDCASAEASLAILHAPVLHWHDEYRDEWVASARVGRRNSGRLLGGLTWDGFP